MKKDYKILCKGTYMNIPFVYVSFINDKNKEDRGFLYEGKILKTRNYQMKIQQKSSYSQIQKKPFILEGQSEKIYLNTQNNYSFETNFKSNTFLDDFVDNSKEISKLKNYITILNEIHGYDRFHLKIDESDLTNFGIGECDDDFILDSSDYLIDLDSEEILNYIVNLKNFHI